MSDNDRYTPADGDRACVKCNGAYNCACACTFSNDGDVVVYRRLRAGSREWAQWHSQQGRKVHYRILGTHGWPEVGGDPFYAHGGYHDHWRLGDDDGRMTDDE